MTLSQLFAAVVVVGSAACAIVAERPSTLAPLRAAPPDVEALVRAALSDRFRAGDIPDQNMLADDDPVYVFDEMECSAYRLGPAALPEVAGKHFALVTRTGASELAYGRRGLTLLEVDTGEVNGNLGKLRIGVSTYPDVTKDLIYGGASAPAEFRRGPDGKWTFAAWGPTRWDGVGCPQ